MKKIVLWVFVWLAGLTCATAEITPMIIKVSSTTNEFVDTYTVPPGKVLVIENYTLNAYAGKIVRLYKGSDVVPLTPEWTSQTPLKIPEGWVIKIDKVTQGTTYYAYLFCLLVDPADLFAYIPNIIKSFSTAGNIGNLLVELSASRPSRIAVASSCDLQEWQTAAPDAVSSDGQSKNRYRISVNCTNDNQFVRTIARARK